MEQPVPSAGEVSLALGASALPDRIYSFGSRPSLCSESGAGGGGGVGGGGSGGEGGAIFEEEGEGDGECADEDVGLSIMEVFETLFSAASCGLLLGSREQSRELRAYLIHCCFEAQYPSGEESRHFSS